MESGTINSFLDRFLGLADAGFGLIQGDVAFVLNALIVISVVLSGAMWALNGEAPIAPLFRKVLFVGFFAFLVNNWQVVATAINQSGAMLGLQAGGGGLTIADLHNPARLAVFRLMLIAALYCNGRGVLRVRRHRPTWCTARRTPRSRWRKVCGTSLPGRRRSRNRGRH